MKPVCVPCERFMRAKKSGFYFIEGMPHGRDWDGKSGKGSPGWLPYKLWVGDLFECPGCGTQTIAGVAQNRLAEHYEPDFAAIVERVGPTLMVKDC